MTVCKKRKKLCSLLLCAALLATGVPLSALALPRAVRAGAGEELQTASRPEPLYVSGYGASRDQNFDRDWKFHLGDAGGAETPEFNDAGWRSVTLPHDYSIEQEYSQGMEAESAYLPGGVGWYRKSFSLPEALRGKRVRLDFDGVYMDAEVYLNGEKLGAHPYGYTPFSFDLTEKLHFDGENLLSVRVNHRTPSSRWYSGSGIYRSVRLSVTDPVHVALNGVKVETPQLPANQTQVDTRIRTEVQNDSDRAVSVVLQHRIYEKGRETELIGSAETEAFSVPAHGSGSAEETLTAENPRLWSVDDPALYTVETRVLADGEETDRYETDYGFRYTSFDSASGFRLNGQAMKLKGVCMHHDQGALGAEAHGAAIRRQVEILKEMGCNSIRVTHNPAARELIEVCNELGMLVTEEIFDGWHRAKNGNRFDYSVWYGREVGSGNQILCDRKDMSWAEYDLKATIRRDWNAPSVIMWSLGNEVQEGAGGGGYAEQARKLIAWARETDGAREVTVGSNALKKNAWEHVNIAGQLAQAGGTVGTNYSGGGSYDALHSAHPDWKLYGSETASSINSRGIYKITGYSGVQNAAKQLTSYDKSRVGWGAFASQAWYDVITRDFVAGEYVWTGFDYLGEPTPWNGTSGGAIGSWPSPKNSYFGIIDTAGFPKDSYYLYQSLWNDELNTLHILPAWNENVVERSISGEVPVVVYSDAPSVELFFTPDGGARRSLGRKNFTRKSSGGGAYSYQLYQGADASAVPHENLYLTWRLPYQPGELEAVAYESAEAGAAAVGETSGRNRVRTARAAASLEAKLYGGRDSILADGRDLAYVELTVADADGNPVPDASNEVKVTVEGNGVLVGLDNGSSPDHRSYQAQSRRAFGGKLLAIVQSTREAGSFTVRAESSGLQGAELQVDTEEEETEGQAADQLISVLLSRHYYVKTGNEPRLAEQVRASYADGSERDESVSWESIPREKLSVPGSFSVRGRLAGGFSFSVRVHVLDEIDALMNYSTAVPIGTAPVLPSERRAVQADGEILDVSFPVNWELPDESAYDQVGIVRIPGTAEVMGKTLPVSCTVRVQEESIRVGSSISAQAAEVTQSLLPGEQSDTLRAVNDGSTTLNPNNSGGPNPSVWSNWRASQNGKREAEITLRYDTQQRIAQANIYFGRDNSSMRYPEEGSAEIYLSETGEDGSWQKLETRERAEESSTNVRRYTYEFAPALFTFLKLRVTNAQGEAGMRWKPCTAITEIELLKAEGSFVSYQTAELESLQLNGAAVPSQVLKSGECRTRALVLDDEDLALSVKGNAACTVLPQRDGKKIILLESEDHSKISRFTILLGQDSESSDPSDGSRDYPRESLSATAGASQPVEPPERALDGNEGTLWHTPWGSSTGPEDRWIQLELLEETELDALRYCARRTGGSNGRVTEYRVELSSDGAAWESAASGTWPDEGGWKLAEFDRPRKAKYVRLWGVRTKTDQAKEFMSAAELRVRMAPETIDISDGANGVAAELLTPVVKLDEITAPVEAGVRVTRGGEELKYGRDYRLRYEGNEDFGPAEVIVEGILKYSGELRLEFTVADGNENELAVEGGVIVGIGGAPVASLSNAVARTGQEVQIVPDETEEGRLFAAWNMTPASVRPERRKDASGREIWSFRMPKSRVRAAAVYRIGDMDLRASTQAEPSGWFAYGDEAKLAEILESSLADEDRLFAAKRDQSVRLVQKLKRSAAAPPLRLWAEDGQSASPSGAGRKQFRSSAVVAALLKEAAGAHDNPGRRVAFYLSSSLEKLRMRRESVVRREELATASNVTVTAELPEEHRNMSGYALYAFYHQDGEDFAEEAALEAEDNQLRFEMSGDAVYALFYTKCFDVKFVDWDGRLLSEERVAYGDAAEAPPEPERPGYAFAEWSRDFDSVTRDIKVKAKYEKRESPAEDAELERLAAKLSDRVLEIRDQLFEANEEDYTAASLKKLKTMLERAETELEREHPKKKRLERALALLNEAYRNLAKKGAGGGSSGGSSPSGGSSSSGGGGSSGSGRRAGAASAGAVKGKWTREAEGWRFETAEGRRIAGAWVYAEWQGACHWYRFDERGFMQTGWYRNPAGQYFMLGADGAMLTGWHWIRGADGRERCYYFHEISDGNRGSLLVSARVQDSFDVNERGEWTVDGAVQLR